MVQPRSDSFQAFLSATRTRFMRGGPIEKKIKVSSGLALGLLLIIGAVLYWGWVRHTETAQEQTRTIAILKTLDRLEFLIFTMIKIEIGERDYLLTGADRYLAPYSTAMDSVRQTVQDLKTLVSASPHQHRRLDTLESLIARKLVKIKETIDVRKHKGVGAAVQVLLVDQGKNSMDEIHAVIDEMENAEYSVMKQQHAEMEAGIHQTLVITVFAGFLAFTAAVLVSGILYYDLTQRKRMEMALRSARDELDHRVQERTAALATTNEALRNEITERKRAEEALQTSEERFRNMAQTAGDAIITIGADRGICIFNRVAERIFGYSAGEIVGQDLSVLIPEEYRERHQIAIQRYLETGQATIIGKTLELKGLRKGGEVFPLELSLSEVRVGNEVSFTGIIRDITERKRVEAALHQQLTRISLLNQIAQAIAERQDLVSIAHVVMDRLESSLSIAHGSVCRYDAQTDTLTILARGLASLPTADALGTPEGTVLPFESTSLRLCMQGETVYVPDTAQIEEPYLQKMAALGLRSVVAVPLMGEQQVLGLIGVARHTVDGFSSAEAEFVRQVGEHVALAMRHITLYEELHRAYEELRQTQEVAIQQERLRALGQMASGIVHDINNTLSAVIGFSELLLMTEPNLSERAIQYVQYIKKAGEDIAQITARMRAFYRTRAQTDPLVPVQLNPLVRQVVELTRPKWRDLPQEHGLMIDIQTEFQDDLPSLLGIESELREALTNLLFNAVDAMPQGGTITIRARTEGRVQRSEGADEQKGADLAPLSSSAPLQVVIEVSDTGVGMDKETRQHCLEPFFTTKGEGGTGLGLAMVFGVVQRHEGEITIDSAPGQGTTIGLRFPVRQATRAAKQDEERPASSRPFHILCIDDEPALQVLLKEMLTLDGHTVEVAEGGRAGIAAFRAAQARGEPFEVVITDLGMPYVDGREVARTIKQESPAVPVLLLTGWGMRLGAEGNIPAQIDAIVSKPPHLNQLRQALARITR